jgi:hypothetical protein
VLLDYHQEKRWLMKWSHRLTVLTNTLIRTTVRVPTRTVVLIKVLVDTRATGCITQQLSMTVLNWAIETYNGESADWIQLALNRKHWWTCVNIVIN